MQKEFISYGIHIDPFKFNRISRSELYYVNKPAGGLWCSPVDSDFGWKDWCLCEGFRENRLNSWTKFELKDSAKILVIDSLQDLEEVFDKYPLVIRGETCLDFQAIERDGYDGVFLTDHGNSECHFPRFSKFGIDLNSWDCESMVLFNLDHIEIEEIV